MPADLDTCSLRTDRLHLREFVTADLDRLRAIEGLSQVLAHMTYTRSTAADYVSFLQSHRSDRAHTPRVAWELAIDAEGVGVIGRCGLKLDDDGRQAMVWYLLDPAAWGNGYATEALRALVNFAFDTLGVHRLWADIDPLNRASAKVCGRLGFRREAHFVQNMLVRGVWCDTWIYALLRDEWPGAAP